MFEKIIIYIFGFIVFLPTICYSSDWHTSPDKWTESRIYYSRFDNDFENHIIVTREKIESKNANKVYSGNKAYWFTIKSPNFMQVVDSWDTIITIFNERNYLIQIKLKNHNNYGTKAQWINEKLIYIKVWWGRILGSYLIYDVEAERIIIKEMIHDGHLPFIQFQQSRDKE